VELLVASAIALTVMAGIAQLFSIFGRSFSQSQATVDLGGRLRSAAWQLRQDLAGVTADVVPWVQPESNSGYFELIEGPDRDSTYALVSGTVTSDPDADTDDILLFTTRSAAGPFVGRFGAGTIEAPCAEVAWFCRAAATQPVQGTTLYNLYRRQLLVVGYVTQAPFSANTVASGNSAGIIPPAVPSGTSTPVHDVSLRTVGSTLVPNTLADLTKRENRFMRNGVYQYGSGPVVTVSSTAFPYVFPLNASTNRAIPNATFEQTTRDVEDVILTNVVAFDVRVFDPQAKAQLTSSPSLLPGDPGYNATTAASGTGATGAYVDLGWGGGSPTVIGGTFPPAGQTALQSRGMRVSSGAGGATFPAATYDTWSLHYETNGIDDDSRLGVDQGTNGADDDGDNIPDDAPEWETSPPYPVPLRGIEVRLRCYEPTSRQIRQITIRHTFIQK
jgi:hypothetical protein